MKRVLLWGLLTPVVLFLGFVALRALESDETRARRLFEGLVTSFHEARAGAFVGHLESGFRGEPDGVGRDVVHWGLREFFGTHADPETGRCLYRVELPDDERVVEFTGGGEATYAVAGWMFDTRRPEEAAIWEFRVSGRLGRQGFRWRVRDARVETLAGRRPR